MKLEINGESVYCYTNNREIDPAKESVFFIHGSGMDHTVWTLASRHFARHGRNVVTVDLPGHGRSSGPLRPSIEAMSDWIIEVMDVLGIAKAAITGHSMGSLVALDCAARHADRVRAIALVGTTAPMPVADAILEAAKADDHAAFDMLTQWGYSKRHLFGGNRNSGIWMVGNTLRLYERGGPGVLYNDMNACNEYTAGLERAPQVQCPALMVLGEEDRLTPTRGTGPLQEALANAQVVVLPGAGHSIMIEEPNALLDALHKVL